MKLRDIMTTNVKVISPTASVQDAARMMRSLDCGALPVCQDDRLVGLVTDRDLVVRALAEDVDVEQFTVADCMTTSVTFCFENQSIDDVIRLMKEQKIRRVPVLNEARRIVGIVALGDLAVQAPQHEKIHSVLESLSDSEKTRAA